MLQVQKLLKLEEVEVKVEEEPKEEVIKRIKWRRTETSGYRYYFSSRINFLYVQVCLDSMPLSSLLYQKVFWLLDETSEEEEGETE